MATIAALLDDDQIAALAELRTRLGDRAQNPPAVPAAVFLPPAAPGGKAARAPEAAR